MKSFKLTALAAGSLTLLSLCAATASAAPVNLVQNGGFELATVTHSTELPADSAVTGSILPSWDTYSGEISYSHLYFPGEATTVGSVCCGGASSATLWAATASPTGGNFLALDVPTGATITQQISGLVVGQQ
jgi:hypothetical protein